MTQPLRRKYHSVYKNADARLGAAFSKRLRKITVQTAGSSETTKKDMRIAYSKKFRVDKELSDLYVSCEKKKGLMKVQRRKVVLGKRLFNEKVKNHDVRL